MHVRGMAPLRSSLTPKTSLVVAKLPEMPENEGLFPYFRTEEPADVTEEDTIILRDLTAVRHTSETEKLTRFGGYPLCLIVPNQNTEHCVGRECEGCKLWGLCGFGNLIMGHFYRTTVNAYHLKKRCCARDTWAAKGASIQSLTFHVVEKVPIDSDHKDRLLPLTAKE